MKDHLRVMRMIARKQRERAEKAEVRIEELGDTLRQALDVLWFHDKGLAESFRKRL